MLLVIMVAEAVRTGKMIPQTRRRKRKRRRTCLLE
jgi:hypothetical protein